MSEISLIESFKQAMRDGGIEPPAEIMPDGSLHRCIVAGDRAKSENGWYCLHADDPAAGAFGCWKRGISEKWCSKAFQSMTRAEKAAYQAKVEAMKRQHEADRQRVQAECRAWCADTWNKADDAIDEYTYLKMKGVQAYGLKIFRDSLIVPVQDVAGTIHGLQFITPDGSKKFKTGTNKAGHFFQINGNEDKIIVSEGYATGATIHQATGHTVIVAFDAGNLLSVAKNIRSQYPDAKIITAADDDHATEGNPGLTKATIAAKAVNGFLAVPVFPEARVPKDTDFNDLARIAGLEAVRGCIDGATMPGGDTMNEAEPEKQDNQLDAAIQRLAALSPLQYDQARKEEAKALRVRPGTLDAEVKAARGGNNNSDNVSLFEEVELWPVPVDPATLLTDIATTIQRFIVCAQEVAFAAALWVAMTWFIDEIQTAPLAHITAPEMRCGKTLLLNFFGKLSARPVTASSISPAALYRTVELFNPTLLIDEADAFLKENEEIRGIINSGHTRDSAYVIRCVGDDLTPTRFSTWGAKALCGIGKIAGTLTDRAIKLELRRKLPHERVERIRHADPCLFDDLRAKLARFADDYRDQVKQARPPLPVNLNDRAQDNWEPLLQIAMVAGDEWLKIGKAAALKLSGSDETTVQTIGTELLADIKVVFDSRGVVRIFTDDLIKALCADDEKPWATYSKGKPITPRQLGKKLEAYHIKSKSIRIGDDNFKGYESKQFKDAFDRYLSPENSLPPDPPVFIRHMTQSAPPKDYSDFSSVTDDPMLREENLRKPSPPLNCDLVTDKNTLSSEESISEEQTDLFTIPDDINFEVM